MIKFGKRETRFKRNLNYALKATSSPSIPLKYAVVHGATGTSNDEFCTTKGGALVWTKPPTIDDHPGMDAFCMVRVSAATTSKNYVTPKPVQALVHIDYPAWAVNAKDPQRSAGRTRSSGTAITTRRSPSSRTTVPRSAWMSAACRAIAAGAAW